MMLGLRIQLTVMFDLRDKLRENELRELPHLTDPSSWQEADMPPKQLRCAV
jgi:hypothetical protein